MLDRFKGSLSKISPASIIVGAVFAVAVACGAVLLLSRHSPKVDASVQPVAARFDQVAGSVAIARVKADDQQLDWSEASVNMPVTVGDRIYARDSAKASIALSGRNYLRLNPDTTVDVLTLADRRTQLALRSGSAIFDVGALSADDFYEVATPCGAVDFREPGLYQIGMDGDNAIISVLSGGAQVVGLDGSGYISKGQVYTLYPQGAAGASVATLAPSLAGDIVDGYYRERYPRIYDGRYRSYDAYLSDPYFYDPYRTSVSCQYVSADVPGLYDLDYYGDWVDLNDYGYCWAPRVSAGWAPFRSGYWDLDDLWGPSWVSSESWGWAPYHYGRWAFVSQRWYWVPTELRTRPVYYPAPVAFIPYQDEIAWVPLGPGEAYVPTYYDAELHPRFLASREVINAVSVQSTFVNFNAPGAVTVVPIRSFNRAIDPGIVATVDTRVIQQGRRTIDPFAVAGVRELALRGEDGGRRLNLSRADQAAFNRAVVASDTPGALKFRSDIARTVRVETVTDRQRNTKLKVEQTGEVSSVGRNGLPQPSTAGSQRMTELATRAERGDRSARRELRQMMRDEQRTNGQTSSTGGQPATAGQQPQLSRKELRQQRRAEQQQAAQPQQNQMRQQRKLERQQQRQATQQQQQAQQTQREQIRQQRRAQQQAPQQQQQVQQRRQQQQVQQRPPEPQTRQQRKEQKRRPPDNQIQQQSLLRQMSGVRSREASRQAQAVEMQRQAAMQRQAIRAQESQRQVVIQQQRGAARVQAAERQSMIQMQQQARARDVQREAAVQQQQAARARMVERAPTPSPQQFPRQQIQQSGGPARGENGHRKHP